VTDDGGLFAMEPTEETKNRNGTGSKSSRATARMRHTQDAAIARGIHPLTHEPLPVPRVGDCGECWWRQPQPGTSGHYPKCHHPATPITRGPATDVLARWPGCHRFTATDPTQEP
jgi:hypothetical protein